MMAEKHFECLVTETDHFRDRDNYPDSKSDSWLASEPTLEKMYSYLAKVKMDETPEEKQLENYTTISFGKIREITIESENEVDLNILQKTSAWKEHTKKLQEEKAALEREAEEQARQLEIQERAELLRLQTKFGSFILN